MAATPEEDIKQQALRIQSLLSGITRGLKVEDIKTLSAAFGEMAQGIDVTTKQIIGVAQSVDNIARTAFGVRSKEAIDKARLSLEALDKAIVGNTSGIQKAYINKMKFELEMEDVKNAKLQAQQKDFLAILTANARGEQLKMLKGMEAIFGTQIASKFMALAGPIGIGIVAFTAIMMALQGAFNQSKIAIDGFKGSWASTGGMVAKSTGEYLDMTAKVSSGFYAMSEVGYTAKSSMELVQKSMSEMGWALGFTAIQSEHFTGSLVEQTIAATQRTRELVLDMGRMSTVIFGSTEEVGKFVKMSNLYNITTRDGVKILGTGIGTLASRMHLDAGVMMNTINNMGSALLGTGASIDSVTRTFIPLIKNVENFAKSANLSTFETNALMQGVETLSKGVDTFLYMAASGKTDLEKQYAGATAEDPLTKAKAIIDRVSKEIPNSAMASIALKGMGMFGDMNEAMRIKMVDFFKTTGNMDKLKGKTEEEKMREIFGVKSGEEDVYAKIASAQLAGHNLQEQMVGLLEKILGSATTFFIKMLNLTGQGKAADTIRELNMTKTTTIRSGSSQYNYNATLGK